MTLSWLSVDAKTGGVLADLPDLDVPKVSRSICRYDSTTATLPIPTAPEGWELATRPGGAVMILLDDSGAVFGVQPVPRDYDDVRLGHAVTCGLERSGERCAARQSGGCGVERVTLHERRCGRCAGTVRSAQVVHDAQHVAALRLHQPTDSQ